MRSSVTCSASDSTGHRACALPPTTSSSSTPGPGDASLAEGRLLDGECNDGIFDLLRHAVLQHRLLAADLLQCPLAAFVVEFLEAVEAVAAVAHHLAGLADIAELLGKLQQSNLGTDNFLLGGHGVLQSPRRGASQPRPAPRPASACDSPGGPGHQLSD